MSSAHLHLLLILLVVHARVEAQATDKTTRQRVEWFIYDAPAEWFGNNRQAIIKNLGSPRHISHTLNANPQDTLVTDSVFTLEYDSASFVVYAATVPPHEFLMRASVWGPRYLRRSPLPFGTPMQNVRAYFSDSSRAPTSTLVYSCTGCEGSAPGSTVAVWFHGGRLVGLKWDYEID